MSSQFQLPPISQGPRVTTSGIEKPANAIGVLATILLVTLSVIVIVLFINYQKTIEKGLYRGLWIAGITIASLGSLLAIIYWILIGIRHSERIKDFFTGITTRI